MQIIDAGTVEMTDDEALAYGLYQSNLDYGQTIEQAAHNARVVFELLGISFTPDFWAWIAR